jgi:hypothetical protein
MKDDGGAHVWAVVKEMAVHKMPPSVKGRFIKASRSNAYLLTDFDVSESLYLKLSTLKVLCSIRPACMHACMYGTSAEVLKCNSWTCFQNAHTASARTSTLTGHDRCNK